MTMFVVVVGLLIALAFIFFQASVETSTIDTPSRFLQVAESNLVPRQSSDDSKLRILYIVTSSNARYSGGNKQNQDRLQDVVFPVILDAVESLTEDHHVDLYLILSYELESSQYASLRQALPSSVGLEVWNDATPLKYVCEHNAKGKCWGKTRKRNPVPPDRANLWQGRTQLARQHRYVVKEKFPYYDYFMAFEDDIRITNHHFQQHCKIMAELRTLRELAPTNSNAILPKTTEESEFWGTLTKDQLDHIRPGFLRVEVLPDEKDNKITLPFNLDPIPVDMEFTSQSDSTYQGRVDPKPCCHPKHVSQPGSLAPQFPKSSQLVFWETAARALSVRKMPQSSSTTMDWVMLFPRASSLNLIPSFWAGDAATHSIERPFRRSSKLIAQSAGWMASRQEILDLNRMCHGGFLPPFEGSHMPQDGLVHDVEFWSGGIQMYSDHCNIHRIAPLNDPDAFSRHLLYHTANNKHYQGNIKDRVLRIDDLMGQMNTVQKVAQRRMEKMIRQTKKAVR
jgi:hypothetical protein